MPELPEVEAQRLMLKEHAVGHRVATVVVIEQGGGPRDGIFDDKVIAEGVSPSDFSSAVEGAFILAARRKGKQLWLELGAAPAGPPSASLLMHLGMTGSLLVRGVEAPRYKSFSIDDSLWPPRFTKLELTLSSGATIAYADPRRFGRILLRGADPTASPPLSLLAKDPVLGPPLVSEFRQVLMRLNIPIKGALLDQSRVVCGVGNWVADEVLFQASILPSAPCRSLSDEQLDTLHAAVIRICSEACACQADSSRFPTHWLFHHRWQKLTSGSMASPLGRIHFDTVAGRTTAFLPTLQRKGEREEGQLAIRLGAGAASGKKRPAAGSKASVAGSSGEGATSGGAAVAGASAGGKKRRAPAAPKVEEGVLEAAESGTALAPAKRRGKLSPTADAGSAGAISAAAPARRPRSNAKRA
jgi:formamidopyrimidine-DNA glycosylase